MKKVNELNEGHQSFRSVQNNEIAALKLQNIRLESAAVKHAEEMTLANAKIRQLEALIKMPVEENTQANLELELEVGRLKEQINEIKMGFLDEKYVLKQSIRAGEELIEDLMTQLLQQQQLAEAGVKATAVVKPRWQPCLNPDCAQQLEILKVTNLDLHAEIHRLREILSTATITAEEQTKQTERAQAHLHEHQEEVRRLQALRQADARTAEEALAQVKSAHEVERLHHAEQCAGLQQQLRQSEVLGEDLMEQLCRNEEAAAQREDAINSRYKGKCHHQGQDQCQEQENGKKVLSGSDLEVEECLDEDYDALNPMHASAVATADTSMYIYDIESGIKNAPFPSATAPVRASATGMNASAAVSATTSATTTSAAARAPAYFTAAAPWVNARRKEAMDCKLSGAGATAAAVEKNKPPAAEAATQSIHQSAEDYTRSAAPSAGVEYGGMQYC